MRLGLDNKFSAGEYSRKILSKIPISKMSLKTEESRRMKDKDMWKFIIHTDFQAAIQKKFNAHPKTVLSNFNLIQHKGVAAQIQQN